MKADSWQVTHDVLWLLHLVRMKVRGDTAVNSCHLH